MQILLRELMRSCLYISVGDKLDMPVSRHKSAYGIV